MTRITITTHPAAQGTSASGAQRRRPVSEIVDEIRALKERGRLAKDEILVFTDENIVADITTRDDLRDTTYVKELFEALIPLDILWTAQSTLNIADDAECVEVMARSGCVQLHVSFQSISHDNLLTRSKLGNSATRYRQEIDRLQRHGIHLVGTLILGTDEDTPVVFKRTARFIDAAIDIPRIAILTPLPGSPLYRQLKDEGRILHDDTSRYDRHHIVYEPKHMSPAQLENGYRWLVKHTFSTAAILKRTARAASRSLVYQHPRRTLRARLTSILASNLMYRAETLRDPKPKLLKTPLQELAKTRLWEQVLLPEPVGAERAPTIRR